MKLKIMFITAVVCLSQSAFAVMPPKPEKCPTVSAIQGVGIINVEADDAPGKYYVGVQSSSYDTKENWTFALGPILADNADDAKNKGLVSLASITLQRGPIPFIPAKSWVCQYKNTLGYPTGAVTPALGNQLRSAMIFH